MKFFKIKGILNDIYEMYAIGENFDLYRLPSDAPVTRNMVCYIDDGVTVSDEGEGIYLDFIAKNKLEIFILENDFFDVILTAFEQAEDSGVDTLVEALNYYDGNDNFLEISM